MDETGPVTQLVARFADEVVAGEVADALNRWFAWVLEGGGGPVPAVFEPLGVETAAWAWSLGEDVDWEVGPHARAVGEEVRVDLETHDTHLRLLGLLKALGGHAPRVVR